jgi:hypothetical protein
MSTTPADRPTFYRGQDLLAEDLNRLVSWIEGRTRLLGGPGVEVVQGSSGTTISVAQAGVRGRYPARITVAPAGAASATPVEPGSAVYTAVADAPHNAVEFTGVPTLGRPVRPDQPGTFPFIVPAKVGDYCEIIVRGDPANPGQTIKELRVETEAPFWNTCA